MSQTTTLTFFKYKGIQHKIWAFGMMQFAHRHLKNVPGLTFYKLLGSGKGNGFNPWPDYTIYALLQVWGSQAQADAFFAESNLMNRYRAHSREQWTLYMNPLKADGSWSGQNPFWPGDPTEEISDPHIAVITRATIKRKLLWKFWRYVPTSEKPLTTNSGLIYTKGIGEVPFIQMATFSLWKDESALKRFAYESREHGQAIKLTRSLDWYKEEMFIRFKPFKSVGTWMGKDPLAVSERLQ